jgi:hypothetical protein
MSAEIERVLVALDAASENAAVLDTAARLAARAKTPLHGIFVEDEDLLRLAALPFARQATLGAGAQPLGIEEIERHLRAAAERARRDLEEVARRHHVKWSFEIVRSEAEQVLASTNERDLIVAGTLTRPVGAYFRVESRWFRSAAAAPGSVLLTRHGWAETGLVVVLLRDRSAGALRLLDAAVRLAEVHAGALSVICPPAVASASDFEVWLGQRLAGHALRLQIEVAPAEPEALQRRIVELDCRLLAIEAANVENGGTVLRDFAERFACDLLVVR